MAKIRLAERLKDSKITSNVKEAIDCVFHTPQDNIDTTLLILKQKPEIKTSNARILEETATVPTTGVTAPNDNVIYVKPDAIFGMGLSLFIFIVAYIGVMCLYNTHSPKDVPRKPFKFGREM